MPTNDLLMNIISPIAVIAIVGVVLSVVLNVLTRKLKGQTSPSKSRKAHSDPPENAKTKVTAQELIERGDAYVKRPALLTEPEKMLFKVLQSKYGDDYHVFAQVRVVDVIRPNTALYEENSREWLALFRQVSQWHFDFVICEKESLNVMRVIELDDSSHNRKDRARRDGVINRVCREVKVEMERVDLRVFHEMTTKA